MVCFWWAFHLHFPIISSKLFDFQWGPCSKKLPTSPTPPFSFNHTMESTTSHFARRLIKHNSFAKSFFARYIQLLGEVSFLCQVGSVNITSLSQFADWGTRHRLRFRPLPLWLQSARFFIRVLQSTIPGPEDFTYSFCLTKLEQRSNVTLEQQHSLPTTNSLFLTALCQLLHSVPGE